MSDSAVDPIGHFVAMPESNDEETAYNSVGLVGYFVDKSESNDEKTMWVYDKHQRRNLERLAPWADLDLIRENIIKYVKEHRPSRLEEMSTFVSGEVPYLPYSIYFKNIVRSVLDETYFNNAFVNGDSLFRDGKQAIIEYFFNSYSWTRCETA